MARARRRWMRERGLFDPARLVFIDETAANTKMMRLGGRCRARRALDWPGSTAMENDHLRGRSALQRNDSPMVIDGAMKGKMFLDYVEQRLVPTPKRNDTVVMDNLPVTQGSGRARSD